jgi:hypothetical protein
MFRSPGSVSVNNLCFSIFHLFSLWTGTSITVPATALGQQASSSTANGHSGLVGACTTGQGGQSGMDPLLLGRMVSRVVMKIYCSFSV